MNYLVAVDPGTAGTGVAIFDLKHKALLAWGSFYSKQPTYEEKLPDLALQIVRWLPKLEATNGIIVMERPQFMMSYKGQVAANSDALVKLSVLAGYLWGSCFPWAAIQFVKIGAWKGTLPKNVVANRLRKRWPTELGNESLSTHAMDAVGIGTYAMENL